MGDNINITGNFSPANLNVDGLTQLDQTQIDTDDGNLDVTGANRVNLNNTNGLQVANGTDLNGVLDVAGQTDLAAAGVSTNVRGDLNVAQGVDFDQTLNVDGNLDANSGVDITGADLTVATNTDLNGTLDVAGQTDLAAVGVSTNVRGDLNVAQGVDFDQTLNVDGNLDANAGVDVTAGDLTVADNANITTNLDVDGATSLDQVSINTTDGALAVTGNSGVDVTQDASAIGLTTTTSGDITLTSADDINPMGDNINITGNFSPANLNVDGLTQLDQTQIDTDDGNLDVTGANTYNPKADDTVAKRRLLGHCSMEKILGFTLP